MRKKMWQIVVMLFCLWECIVSHKLLSQSPKTNIKRKSVPWLTQDANTQNSVRQHLLKRTFFFRLQLWVRLVSNSCNPVKYWLCSGNSLHSGVRVFLHGSSMPKNKSTLRESSDLSVVCFYKNESHEQLSYLSWLTFWTVSFWKIRKLEKKRFL